MEIRLDALGSSSRFLRMPNFAPKLTDAFRRVFMRESWLAALLLLLLLSLDFFPCIFGHKSLLESAQFCPSILRTGAWAGKRPDSAEWPKTIDPAAAAWFTEPSLAINGWEYWQAKTLPLWNPYQGLGQPYAADMQSQPFFPLAILLSLHVIPKTYNLFLLSRLFVAGLGAYLFLRLFTSFIPAMAAGIAMMLAGYFVVVISLPYLSVETLTPLMLYAAEVLLRSPSRKTICGFAAAIALVMLGGMPESSVLTYTFIYSYILFRIISDASLRRMWIKRSASVLAGTIIGLCLAAFVLLPMVELVHHSYNTHEPGKNGGAMTGLWHDNFGPTIFTYILPLVFGQPYASTFSDIYNGNGTRNYWGAIPLFLVLIALCSLKKSENLRDRRLSQTTCFFFACAVIIILKRYGCPLINSLGNLPLLRVITFAKYDEPLLSMCVAALCGIGLERIVTKAVSWRIQITVLCATFAIVVLAVFLSRNTLLTAMSKTGLSPMFPLIAVGLPLCLLFCVSLCYALQRQAGSSRYLAMALLVFVAAEMSLNYIPEIYYVFSTLPNTSENPYAGAPYINWLKANNGLGQRIFARGGALYPDWASVFRLPDIRDLDALYYWKFLPFIRDFMLAPGQPGGDDFQDRFTGAGSYSYNFDNPLQRRLLQLTSAGYLITNAPYSQPDFQLNYDHEVKIYRYDHVLPRAALYSRVKVARNDTEVLQSLADPNFNVFDTVVLNAAQLSPAQAADVDAINRGELRVAESGHITDYEPMKVEIEAGLPESGVLVLNDAEYPGWGATVDGKPSKILSANYIFRGLLLGPGRHRIRFIYRPRTFRLGSAISLITLFALLISFVPLPQRLRVFRSPQRNV